MKCPQCGLENRESAQFCLGCGRRLKSGATRGSVEKKPKPRKVVRRRKTSGPQTIQKGRYLVIQKLGSGGMSRVYLARDTKMDCNVVIKEMFPPKTYPEKKAYFLKKFKNEAKLLYRLRHPGIPRVTDYFAESGNYYMVMEYIEGENIDAIIKKRKDHKISADDFFSWMGKLLEVIRFLHNQKPPIFHRDIKPANFMLDSRGNVFLVDFGVAKVIAMEEAHTRIGTIGYASPEHFTGKFIKSSDLFSLGASFHFMLSGDDPRYRLPFDFPPLSVYRKDLPEGIVTIISKMLEKEPKNRYSSVEQLKKEFVKVEKEYKGPSSKPGQKPITPEGKAASQSVAPVLKPKAAVSKTENSKAPETPQVSEDSEHTVRRPSGKLDLPILKKSRRTSRQMIRKIAKADSNRAKIEKTSQTVSPRIKVRPVDSKPKIEKIVSIKKPQPREVARAAVEQPVAVKAPAAKEAPPKPVEKKTPEMPETEYLARKKKSRFESVREKLAASKRESRTPPRLLDRAGDSSKPSILKRTARSPITGKPMKVTKTKSPKPIPTEVKEPDKTTPEAPTARGVKKHELPPRPSEVRPKKSSQKKEDTTVNPKEETKKSEQNEIFPVTGEKRFPRGEPIQPEKQEHIDLSPARPKKPVRIKKKNPLLKVILIIIGIILVGGAIFYFTKLAPGKKDPEKEVNISEEDRIKAQEFFKKGEEAFKERNYNKAVKNLNRAIKINKNIDPYAYYYRGLAYRIKKDYFRSIEDLEQFKRNETSVNVDNELSDNYFKRSYSAFNKGNYSEAISDMEESINLLEGLKKIKEVELRESITRKKTKRVNEIRKERAELNTKVSKINIFLSDAFYKRGMESLNNKEYEAALTDFKASRSKNNKNREASLGISRTYLERGKEFEKNGNQVKAMEDYAGALSFEENLSETLQWIRKDDKVRKTLSKHLIDNAMTLKKKGELDGALKNIETAQKLTPENPEIKTYLSRILTSLGDSCIKNEKFKDAEKYLSRAIKMNPDNKKAMTKRALCKLNLKNYDGAIEETNNVLKLDKTFVDAFLVRGTAYFYQKKYNKAKEDLEKVRRLDPGSNNAHAAENILKGFPR